MAKIAFLRFFECLNITNKMNKAVFFDRDGVLNKEIGDYISHPDALEILPDVPKALMVIKEKGYMIIVITNQGGIAKGLYTHETLQKIHQKLANSVGLNMIDAIYYCPHHNTKGKCICRKPDSLMLEKAISKYNINKGLSFLLGDKERDILSAQKVGIKAIQIESNSSFLEWAIKLQ